MKKMDKNSHSSGGLWQKQVRIMKLCFILTFIGILHLSAATYSQDTRLDLKVKNASLESVMNDIRTQSEYSFFFDDIAVKKISNITLDLKGATIEEVLATCLKNTGFSFRVLDKTIILFREQAKNDKKKLFIIQGKVLDENNKPMPGVTVLLDSTKVGTSTDIAGHFVLPLPEAKGTLVFSFIGYKTQKVKYTDGKLVMVKMQADVSGLDEVQVVAYGSQKKRTLVSSISTLKADEMKELPTHSLESLLQGHMAGVEVNNLSGAPGGGGAIVAIRGYNSFFVDGEGSDRNYGTPLYVGDGVPMQAFTSPITGTNTLSDLDPSMIESIEVLKDAASAAIYGSRAGNGVILITTKKGRAGKAQFVANASYSASWLPETIKVWGGNIIRNYNMNAYRNTVKPYQSANGKWVIPNSYEEVYKYTKNNDFPIYNYFFGNRDGGQNAYMLQDSLNPFYNNSTDWNRYAYRTAKVYNANLQASGGSDKDSNPTWKSASTYKSSLEEERMNSYFGRLRYNFKEKYMLEATIRRDGSSVFGEDVRWATFPSVAAGWIFSDEPFIKKFYWLSFGKIRASWGRSGQKFYQPYLAHGLMGPSGQYFLGKEGMMPDRLGGLLNRKLSWEKTDQYDLGLDVSFLDYRIKMTLDYYYRYTKGQLRQVDLPGNLNLMTFQWQNALAVSNEGLEMELTADIFRETTVKWRTKINVSRNWNRFEKSGDGYDYGNNIIGKPLYNILAYKMEGFYNNMDEIPYYLRPSGMLYPLGTTSGVFFTGTRRLADLNGNGSITDNDMYYAASPLPVAHGGIINEITWKQFDLNIFFIYSIGRHILRTYDDLSLTPNADGAPLYVNVEKINAWTGEENSKPKYPHLIAYEVGNQYSGRYDCDIEKVHMLRLKQLTLGYNLHQQFAQKIGLTSARIFLTAENLFLLTNYSGLDPEIVDITKGIDNSGAYPLPRKFSVGLTVNF